MLSIRSNVNLQPYNTLAVPAIADFLVQVCSVDDLKAALKWCKNKPCPLLVLGGGSNIILKSDFPGLVVQVNLKGIDVVSETPRDITIKVGAGEVWADLVAYTLNQGYGGLENLSLIPGCAGAAPIQNIGAYGVQLDEVFSSLEAVDINTGETVVFHKAACVFGYRDSVFKNQLKDRYVIVSISLQLQKYPRLNCSYPALKAALDHAQCEPSPRLISQLVTEIRTAKLPNPDKTPNVGSFFKNPIIAKEKYAQLKQHYPALVAYPASETTMKLAAGWLIDQLGWRGYAENGVSVHDAQALVLVNPGRSEGKAVLSLAEKIRQSVLEHFGVELEVEPRIYP